MEGWKMGDTKLIGARYRLKDGSVQDLILDEPIILKKGNMKRASGFYWVRDLSEWIVAEWSANAKLEWFISGSDYPFYDADFEEIDENRIVRTVNKEPHY